MPFLTRAVIGSRHLGLVTAKEIGSLKKDGPLAAIAEETIDLDLLLDIANNAEHFDYEKIEVEQISDVNCVAKDRAFAFNQDSRLKRKMGAS